MNNKGIDFFILNFGFKLYVRVYQPFRPLRTNPVFEVIKHVERKALW